MDENIKIHTQLKHCFYLHNKYIYFDELFEVEEDDQIDIDNDEEDDYDSFKQWAEDERNDLNDVYQKPDSEVYPFFKDFESLKVQIEVIYPKIIWKNFEEPQIRDKIVNVYFGSVYTENGLLEHIITTENGQVYSPLRIEVSLTDYPYKEVRKIAKTYNLYLYHLNSFDYIDIDDDCEIGIDLISPIN